MSRINLVKPSITFDEISTRIEEIINSGTYSGGKNIAEFSSEISKLTKAKYCFPTSSATTALWSCLKILNLKKGDEVLVSDFSYPATVNVIEDLGWGNGVMTGLNIASCDYIGWTHGDLQYDLSTLNEVYDLIKNPENQDQSLLIKGLRKKRSFSENFFTKIMSFIASIILFKKLHDINAQPNFFSRDILNLFENTPKDLMLDLYLYYKTSLLEKKIIIRLPVTQNKRLHGSSSWKKNFFSNYSLSLKQLIGIIKIRLSN